MQRQGERERKHKEEKTHIQTQPQKVRKTDPHKVRNISRERRKKT